MLASASVAAPAGQLPHRALLHNNPNHDDSEDGREVDFGTGIGVSFGSVGAPGIVVVGSKVRVARLTAPCCVGRLTVSPPSPSQWGLEDQVQLHAERLATYGFHCLAPDLYHGALPSVGDDDEANAMAETLNCESR